ncbi:hypothetical protein DY000_02049823 [Brassica cretica]|uniref:Uncharacterized protein n=1 Tax=Brassica cretica TaxID=69181 RepID=A0ABQ7EQG7_BRACR|nr:hypothetical protein DY000_02049823 [Brassica cretica]
MAASSTLLANLRAGRCSNNAEVRLLSRRLSMEPSLLPESTHIDTFSLKDSSVNPIIKIHPTSSPTLPHLFSLIGLGRLQETGEIKNTLDATAKGNPYIHSCLWFFHSMIRENTDYVSKYCSPAAFHSPSRQAYTSRQSPSSRLQGFFCANLFVRDSVD